VGFQVAEPSDKENASKPAPSAPAQEVPAQGVPAQNAPAQTQPAQDVPAQSADRQPAEQRPTEAPANQPPAAEKTETPANQLPAAENAEGGPPEIIVTVTPQGIFYSSKDLDALDQFETLLRSVMAQRATNNGGPAIFYLKHAKAEVASELLMQMITGNTNISNSGGGSSLFGNVAQSMLGDAGGLLAGALGLGGSSATECLDGPGSAAGYPADRTDVADHRP
jgi:hypothetical protein